MASSASLFSTQTELQYTTLRALEVRGLLCISTRHHEAPGFCAVCVFYFYHFIPHITAIVEGLFRFKLAMSAT